MLLMPTWRGPAAPAEHAAADAVLIVAAALLIHDAIDRPAEGQAVRPTPLVEMYAVGD